MYLAAKIAVENASWSYDKLYSYLLPGALADLVKPGCRVKVPFGGGNRSRTGIVLSLEETASREGLKPVSAAVDSVPILGSEGLMLLRYLKEQTFCTWFDALRLLIPAGMGVVYEECYLLDPFSLPEEELPPRQSQIVSWLQGRQGKAAQSLLCSHFGVAPDDPALASLLAAGILTPSERWRKKIQDDKVCMARLSDDYRPERLTPKQKLVATFLEEVEAASLKEICYYTGVTRVVVDNMRGRGQVECFEIPRYRSPFEAAPEAPVALPCLSPSQQAAFERLDALSREEKPAPCLLFGVTGSGKTAVFLRLIEEVTARKKNVLMLTPEIALTAQAVAEFRRRFGGEVAVLHSGLSLGERMDEWRRIRDGEASIVVGTRSAVFAPLQNIGLVVIDEEQEHTYRSDKSPRFHAREIALLRCRWHGALLLLASATPSVETYSYARQGKYHLVTLEERYNGAPLPDVYIVDMGEAENLSPCPTFSQLLAEELRLNLERNEQSILLLNRRGYAPIVRCASCTAVADCPHCSVAMTYHSANDSLLCHYCGYAHPKPKNCANCGSELIRYAGIGTQKLVEDLASLFPQARILRVDMDTTMAKYAHEKLFASFSQGEYDIMVGTQMVAKGLNFPNVTLVGVLGADQSLYGGDFRSFERSFSLLTQVVGRGGRGQKRGRALIQTFSPDNHVLQLAARQDYPAFYEQEITSRRLHLYPPFCSLAGVGFVGENLEEVQDWAARFLDRFKAVAASDYGALPIRALGPAPSEVLRAAGKYRYKILIKFRPSPEIRALLAGMLDWFYSQCKTVSVFVDMHYDRI